MKSSLSTTLGIFLAFCAAYPVFAAAVAADVYPNRPVRLILPAAVGGSTDLVGRIVALQLTERMGVQVVADNRAGAGGIIAMEMAAKAPADGYTLLLVSASQSAQPALRKQLPYDPVKSFAPIAKLASVFLALVVHPSVPANSAKQLIALAKRKPGEIIFSGSGTGAHTSMATHLFKIMADIDIVIVEYKSGGPAVIDLLGGHTQAMLATIASVLPQIKAGKLRALATSGTGRSVLMPDTPTLAETAVPGYATVQWHGLVVPAGTPAPVVDRLQQELKAILASDDTKKTLLNAGVEPDYLGPAEFGAFSKRELEQWAGVVKKANITLRE
jgi:tripartite-type tricarboxylate transporter receptor subunit TctC